jgi:hypothetical protein
MVDRHVYAESDYFTDGVHLYRVLGNQLGRGLICLEDCATLDIKLVEGAYVASLRRVQRERVPAGQPVPAGSAGGGQWLTRSRP